MSPSVSEAAAPLPIALRARILLACCQPVCQVYGAQVPARVGKVTLHSALYDFNPMRVLGISRRHMANSEFRLARHHKQSTE